MRRLLALTLTVMVAPPALADFNAGIQAVERGDYGAAYKEFKPLADQGDARAQSNLAVMHAQGHGMEQSYPEAARLFRQAPMWT